MWYLSLIELVSRFYLECQHHSWFSKIFVEEANDLENIEEVENKQFPVACRLLEKWLQRLWKGLFICFRWIFFILFLLFGWFLTSLRPRKFLKSSIQSSKSAQRLELKAVVDSHWKKHSNMRRELKILILMQVLRWVPGIDLEMTLMILVGSRIIEYVSALIAHTSTCIRTSEKQPWIDGKSLIIGKKIWHLKGLRRWFLWERDYFRQNNSLKKNWFPVLGKVLNWRVLAETHFNEFQSSLLT